MIIILVALVLQVIIGIKIYKASANIFAYMSDLWTSASTSYRIALQNEANLNFLCNLTKESNVENLFFVV